MILLLSLIGTWIAIRGIGVSFGVLQFDLWDGVLCVLFAFGVVGVAIDAIQASPVLEPIGEPEEIKNETPLPSGPRSGWVYLVKGSQGYYKIGRSKDPSNRYETFKLNLPFEVEYEHEISCRDMYQAESTLHKAFEHRRSQGTEWFKLTANDIVVIKSIKEM